MGGGEGVEKQIASKPLRLGVEAIQGIAQEEARTKPRGEMTN
jgi:hypothetical protein